MSDDTKWKLIVIAFIVVGILVALGASSGAVDPRMT